MKKLLLYFLLLPALTWAQSNPSDVNNAFGTAPVVTSLESLTKSSANFVVYDGDLWKRTSGAVTTSHLGYPGYVVPAVGSWHYERDRKGLGVNVIKMGVVADSNVLSTQAMFKARMYARSIGSYPFVPHAGRQKYLIGPQELLDGERIYGDEAAIKKPAGVRGYTFYGNVNNTLVTGFRIYCAGSDFEGAYYVSGSRNRFTRFEVYNGDASSVVVSGMVFNSPGTYVETRDNLIEHGYVTGQRKYHEGGGKSPYIAGDGAINTIFRYCTAADNGPGISIDDFDSDHAPGTRFEFCAVKNKVFREGTGFWSEGEQPGEHKVYVIGGVVENKRIGAGSSENAQMNIAGMVARNCRNAVNGLNNLQILIAENVQAIGCGNGLANTDIEGVFTFAGPATLTNCYSDSTLAKYDLVNYSGSTGTGTLTVNGGRYFRAMVAYENSGNALVVLNGAAIMNQLRWQSEALPTRKVHVKGGRIRAISGAGIAEAIIDGVTMVGMGTGTAVNISPTNANTKVINTSFDNYEKTVENATFGLGNTYRNITIPPVLPEEDLVRRSTGGQVNADLWVTNPNGSATLRADRFRIPSTPTTQGFPGEQGYGIRVESRTATDNTSPAGSTNAIIAANSIMPYVLSSIQPTTYTDAFSFWIGDKPVAGNNVSIGRGWALGMRNNLYVGGKLYVGPNIASQHPSAAFEVNSTTGGLLPPQMTSAERAAIASPTAGLMVYQTNGMAGHYYYTGTAWVRLKPDLTLSASATFEPGTLTPGQQVSTTLTVAGAQMGQRAWASFSQSTGGIVPTAEVISAGQVRAYFTNTTTANVTIPAGTLTVGTEQ